MYYQSNHKFHDWLAWDQLFPSGMPDIPSEIALLEHEIASLQFVAALTRVSSIREAAKERLAARRRRLRKLSSLALASAGE